MRKVLVFGTFDGLHAGHIHFLKQAKRLARDRTSTHSAVPTRGRGERRRFDLANRKSQLIVAVAPDKIVKQLKNKTPRLNEKERKELVASLKIVDQAMIGDREVSSYKIVKRLKPNIICLGYDQKKLAKDLKKHLPNMNVVILKAYKRRKMHTSKLTVNN